MSQLKMANLGSCYIKSCWVMTLRSVNSNIHLCVHARVFVIESLGSTPARLGPAMSLDLISHSGKLLCGTGAYGREKKRVLLSFVPLFYRRPIYPQRSQESCSFFVLLIVLCPCLSSDGFGGVHHLTYEYRHPGRHTERDELSSLS